MKQFDLNFAGKKVVVMGLGLYKKGSGLMAASFFAKQKAKVLVTDLQSQEVLAPSLRHLRKYPNITFVLGKHRKKDFEKADLVFQNPSVPDSSPYLQIAKAKKIPILNDWSIFLTHPKFDSKNFLAVTGTRGKSTTTSLLFEMIKSVYPRTFLAGNIGVSPLSFFQKYRGQPVVAELSSWLLRGLKPVEKSPHIAIFTNLYRDHLDKYPSFKSYLKDKTLIFRYQKEGDFLVINRDNPWTFRLGKTRPKNQVFWFSKKKFLGQGIYLDPKRKRAIFQDKKKKIKIDLKEIKLLGKHNLENILAATCAALLFGIPQEKIQNILSNFYGLPNRFELLGEVKGIKFINDTTATSPDGVVAALKTLKNHKRRIILLAGGSDKNLDFREMASLIAREVKALILFQGKASQRILKSLPSKTKMTIIYPCLSMKEAFKKAVSLAQKGDIVLLSPGAASFGIFKNEFDRGEQFVKLFKQYQKEVQNGKVSQRERNSKESSKTG